MNELESKETPAENPVINLYKETAPEIHSFVRRNGGRPADAAQLMEEALLKIYLLARFKNFQPSSAFSMFFIAWCKKQWLTEIKSDRNKFKKNAQKANAQANSLSEDINLFQSYIEKYNSHLTAFEKIDPRCRLIISGLLSGEEPEQLATEQNTSVDYLQRKKSECIASIFKFLNVKPENTGYSFLQIAAYAENAMEVRRRAALDHDLAFDPTLRNDLEKYLDLRTSLRMKFEKDQEMDSIKQILSDLRTEYPKEYNSRRQIRKTLVWIILVAALLFLLYLAIK